MSLQSDVNDVISALEFRNGGALFLLQGHRSLTYTGRKLAQAAWDAFRPLLDRAIAAEDERDALRAEVEGLRAQNEHLTTALQRAEGGGDGSATPDCQARLKWLGGRLANRARDARQAEENARRLSPSGYPYALRLAEVHAHVAEVYELEAAEVAREIEQEGGAR